jgi:hypothetical protein
MTYIYLLFEGQRFISTCHTRESAAELASRMRLKDPFIKRVRDVDR